MDYATGGQAAVVVAEDTDNFVMLLYHYCEFVILLDRTMDWLQTIDWLQTMDWQPFS